MKKYTRNRKFSLNVKRDALSVRLKTAEQCEIEDIATVDRVRDKSLIFDPAIRNIMKANRETGCCAKGKTIINSAETMSRIDKIVIEHT